LGKAIKLVGVTLVATPILGQPQGIAPI